MRKRKLKDMTKLRLEKRAEDNYDEIVEKSVAKYKEHKFKFGTKLRKKRHDSVRMKKLLSL